MESNFPRNDNSACVALSKGSKVGIRNVYLAAFEYFRPGIMRFDRPIRSKHFMPCARVVDKTALGTRLGRHSRRVFLHRGEIPPNRVLFLEAWNKCNGIILITSLISHSQNRDYLKFLARFLKVCFLSIT